MMTLRKQIEATTRYFPHIVFVCCVLIMAFTILRTNVFFSPHWPSALWQQTVILFAVVGLIATATAIAAALFRLNLELLIALLVAAMIMLFCGPAATAVVLYFLISAACLARLLFLPFRNFQAVPLNLQIVAGWAVYGITFTILAPAKIHTTSVHTVILTIPILIVGAIPILRRAIWQNIRSSVFPPAAERKPESLYVGGLIACIVILSFHLAEVALPERYFDALVTHLYVPSYIAGHMAWSYDVQNYAFAYMPMTVDFLYANVFLLQGEQSVRLLNFVALLLTCLAIFQIAASCCSRAAAIWTVVLFISIPVALIESTSLFIEHSVALFIVSATLTIVLAGFRISLLEHAIVMLLLAAAAASKIHGAVGAIVLGTASSFFYLRHRRELYDYVRFLMVTASATVLALWPYIEAWRKTGNPVFPFLNLMFKSPYYPLENFTDSRWVGNLSPWMLYDMTFHSSRFLECADGALGFTLFVFLGAGIVAAIYRCNKITLFCVGIGFLAIVIVSLPNQYLRYFYIFVPLLMTGVAFAIDELGRERRWRVAVAAAVVTVAVLNVVKFPAGGWVIGASDLRAIFDGSARRALVLGQVPERIANQAINDIAGPAARVLYFTNPFGALLTGTAIYDDWYNTAYSRDFANIKSETDVDALIHKIAPTFVIFDPSRVQQPNFGQRYAFIASYLDHAATLVAKIGRLSLYRTSFPSK